VPKLTIATLCAQLGIAVPAEHGDRELSGVATLAEATSAHLGFLENPQYKTAAQATKAGAVLVRAADAELLPKETVTLVCPQPYVAYAQALQIFYPQPPIVGGVSQFAVVSSSAKVHVSARVEPYAVIYAGADIGEGAHIGAHAVIGENVVIGAQCKVGAHATLMKCKLGARSIVHSGVRIGQDGFGYAQNGAELVKIPHIGGVTIGENVEIGANSTIDAGALSDTVIEDGVKLDKQVQIAHNVRLGKGVRIAAQSGIAGSTTIGAHCVIGGQAGVAGHLEMAPQCMVAAASAVTKSIVTPGSVVAGVPAVPIAQWRQQMASIALAAKRAARAPQEAAKPAAKEVQNPKNQAAKPQAPKTPFPLGADSSSPFLPDDFAY
jgi:UDP-3-O-[3-hydroxymyristoyl] glucosamine N-acyltransferase